MDALSYRLELGVVGIVWNCHHVWRETELIKMRSWEPTSSSSWNIFITTKSWNAGMRNVGVLHDGSRVMSPPPKKVWFFSGKFQLPAPQADFLRCLCMELKGGECGKLETTRSFSRRMNLL